ncbi:MAG: 2-succinyl-6-hydroxy-2,4-cyclohexadiene-1-carboxylate synthase [Myxococcaceae bacterium]|nr:2-succinyl-6-hydroxy-2,4-cyclohexadiene-1-carboxylate synthase [Myxococcaceae bacterium]
MSALPSRRWGRGERRALLLHGFTGSRFSFDHLEPLLGDVIAADCVDLPGHHEALTVPADFDGVVEQLASQLSAPTCVIGYSQGARLALALAVARPELVGRLVLESGSPGLHRRHDRAMRRRADAALAGLIESEGVESFIARWEQLPLFSGIRSLPAGVQAQLRARRVSHRPAGLAAALRVMGQGAQPDLWPSLPTLRVPTLLLSGAADAKYTRLARRMAAELPLAWRVSFRGVGHAPHLEAPQDWASEVRSFLTAPWTHEPAAEEAR